MNKESFNQLVGDYSKLDSQFKDLEILMKEFPYSQPVRMLNVKSSSIVSKAKFQERLALAAFYTADRNVLRSLIESGKVPSDVSMVSSPTRKKTRKTVAKKPSLPTKKKKTEKITGGEALRREVLANLALLQKQKQSFLQLDELPSAPVSAPAPARKQKVVVKKQKEVVKKEVKETPAKPVVVSKSPRQTNKRELIDKFIADEPRITPKKPLRENQSDLSKASGELKEDLVSENLALIFARQGKTSKAIDIYKKLIWKFPQKKASFAAQIEVLKKKKG